MFKKSFSISFPSFTLFLIICFWLTARSTVDFLPTRSKRTFKSWFQYFVLRICTFSTLDYPRVLTLWPGTFEDMHRTLGEPRTLWGSQRLWGPRTLGEPRTLGGPRTLWGLRTLWGSKTLGGPRTLRLPRKLQAPSTLWGLRTLGGPRTPGWLKTLWGPRTLWGFRILWWSRKDPGTYELAKVSWFPHHVFNLVEFTIKGRFIYHCWMHINLGYIFFEKEVKSFYLNYSMCNSRNSYLSVNCM